MMKIGLIDIDGGKFPNLALMKISSYHKQLGDEVSFVDIGAYDKTYISKIFNFTNDYVPSFATLGEIVKGGTAYDLKIKLPIEIDNMLPDYSIYNVVKTAYGFLTRGCNSNCNWCLVVNKEGALKPYRDIEEILQGRQRAIIMDNNILGSEYGIRQIEKIVKLGVCVDFNQGIDARFVTPEIAKLLAKIHWIRSIRFACDSIGMISPVIKAMRLLEKYGIGRWRFNNYLLLNDNIESAYKRANKMRELGVSINPQPYRDYKKINIVPQWQKDFARWGHKKQLYNAVDFKDYYARKGFCCGEYFKK